LRMRSSRKGHSTVSIHSCKDIENPEARETEELEDDSIPMQRRSHSHKKTFIRSKFMKDKFLFIVLSCAFVVAIVIAYIIDSTNFGRYASGLLGVLIALVSRLFSPSISENTSPIFIGKQLRIWNILCKEMNIQDEVLHEVVGIGSIPWVEGQPFNYFLPKKRILKK